MTTPTPDTAERAEQAIGGWQGDLDDLRERVAIAIDAAVKRERGRCREIVVQMRNQRQAYRQIIGDPKAQLPQYKHWTEDMINDLTGESRDE